MARLLLWHWAVLCFAEPLVRIYYENDCYSGLKHFPHIYWIYSGGRFNWFLLAAWNGGQIA